MSETGDAGACRDNLAGDAAMAWHRQDDDRKPAAAGQDHPSDPAVDAEAGLAFLLLLPSGFRRPV
jgi:hypothetical protein